MEHPAGRTGAFPFGQFRLGKRGVEVVRHHQVGKNIEGARHRRHRDQSGDGAAVAGDRDRCAGAFHLRKEPVKGVLGLSAADRRVHVSPSVWPRVRYK